MNLRKQLKITLCIVKSGLGRVVKNTTLLFLVFGMSACASGPTQYKAHELSQEQKKDVESTSESLHEHKEKLYSEGRRNQVLNNMEFGLAAFRIGDYTAAKNAFDSAILDVSATYADNEAARKARSLWYEEGQKEFKGEPYERSMLFYYRGLLYLKDADYENARASFENAIMQDAFAEEDQNRSDFALMLYLAGWSAQKMGWNDRANQLYHELKNLRPDSPIPDPEHNVLVISESGFSPRKLADGVGHYQLVYRKGKNFSEVASKIDEKTLYPVSDIYWQASSRGGRAVDRIIEGKAKFKKGAESFGSGLTSVTDNNVVAGLAGGTAGYAAIAGIGVAAMAISANSKPRADTRYWKGLPDKVHVTTMKLPNKEKSFQVTYLDSQGEVISGISRNVEVKFDRKGQGLLYASSRNK